MCIIQYLSEKQALFFSCGSHFGVLLYFWCVSAAGAVAFPASSPDVETVNERSSKAPFSQLHAFSWPEVKCLRSSRNVGASFVGAANCQRLQRWQCPSPAIHRKAVSQHHESTEMNSLFSNCYYFGRFFWRACNQSLPWWLWWAVGCSSLGCRAVLSQYGDRRLCQNTLSC